MKSIISCFGEIFGKIYSVLDVQLFPDFPVTYIQLILIIFVIGFIFKFLFGGMKEFNGVENIVNANLYTRMSNVTRMRQLENMTLKRLARVSGADHWRPRKVELFDYNWLEDGE